MADGEPIASTSTIAIDGQDVGTPNVKMEEYPSAPQRTRSPSVVSSSQGPTMDKGKRAARGKKAPAVSESFEPGNHLPGFRDGLGIFPPRSDLAELMLSLKLRGQRRITKKQRLKLEKEGPPFFPDGSLAFDQSEYFFFPHLTVFLTKSSGVPFQRFPKYHSRQHAVASGGPTRQLSTPSASSSLSARNSRRNASPGTLPTSRR